MDFERLNEMLERREIRALKKDLDEMNEVDIAEFITELSPERTLLVFRMLRKDVSSDVFSMLDRDSQEHIVNSFTDKELAPLVEDLYVDDAVDILEEMPAGVVKRVLKTATPATRMLINQFLQYPEDSAGSIMTAEFVDLKKDLSAASAIEHIRATGLDKETVYSCYVTDRARVLLGVLGFKELICAPEDTPIEQIMSGVVISVKTTDDKELAANLMSKYDLLALPVTDGEGRLCGIVTVDDAFDVIADETAEDFHKMAAVTPLEKPYLKTTVFELYKNRIPWLMLMMVSSMLCGVILEQYSAVIALLPILVSFMPMITATGGNAGSQASTLAIRGMTVAEIEPRDAGRVFAKELGVACVCGVVLAAVNFVRILIMYGAGDMLPIAGLTSCCIFATVVFAKAFGVLLPLAAKALKLDPAIMSAPIITTIVDAVSLLMYYGAATLLFLPH